jgi:hypothetical protein
MSKLLGRDENAAHNILYIFQQQYEDKEGTSSKQVPSDDQVEVG